MSQQLKTFIKISALALVLITSGVIAGVFNVLLAISFLCLSLTGIMVYGFIFVSPPPFPLNTHEYGWIWIVITLILSIGFFIIG